MISERRNIKLLIFVALLSTAWFVSAGFAGDCRWKVSSGDWSTDSNWYGGRPTSSDFAYINNGGTAEITTPSSCHSLYVADSKYSGGTVNHTAWYLVTPWSGGLTLGFFEKSSGTYRLSGTDSLLWTGSETIGYGGAGQFYHMQGAHDIGVGTWGSGLTLGKLAGATGNYYMYDGTLSVNKDVVVGSSGKGYFGQAGGSSTVEGDLHLGRYSGSDGHFALSGGELNVSGNIVGGSGTSKLTYSGGTLSVGGNSITVDNFTIASGLEATYELGGTMQLNVGGEYVGKAGGIGTLRQTGGRNAVNALLVGYSGSGTYELKGGELSTGVSEYVGYYSAGTFTQTAGTNTVGADLYLGYYRNSPGGTYNLMGGELKIARGYDNDMYVGDSAPGTFNIGNADGTGTVTEGSGVRGVDMNVRPNSGMVRGWGVIGLSGCLRNNGRIIADGYGSERTLDLSSFSSLRNNWESSPGNGWFAQDHGELILPSLYVASGSNAYNWGEDPNDASIELLNSVRMEFANVTVGGPLGIDLLAPDHAEVPALAGGTLIGVWDFNPPAGFAFDSVDLIFRYDDALASSLGLSEDGLRVYHHTDGRWFDVTSGIDTTGHWIYANDVTSFSMFAVGSVIPEPSSFLCWLLLGTIGPLAYVRRRRHRAA